MAKTEPSNTGKGDGKSATQAATDAARKTAESARKTAEKTAESAKKTAESARKTAEKTAGSATDAARSAGDSTQEALKASLERAQELAEQAAEAGTDVAHRIQEALETMIEKSKVQSERSRDAALAAIITLLENARRVAADSQFADSEPGQEIEGAIDRAISTVRSGIGGVDPEADKPYEDWTKDELYDRAQALQLKGRGGMKKKELIKALRKHDAHGAKS